MTQVVYEEAKHDATGIIIDIYARVSTDIQEEDGTNLETQVENCCAFASARDILLVRFSAKFLRAPCTGRDRRSQKRETDIATEIPRGSSLTPLIDFPGTRYI